MIIYDEVLSFKLNDFFGTQKEEIIKLHGFKESLIEAFIEAFFSLQTSKDVECQSKGLIKKRAI